MFYVPLFKYNLLLAPKCKRQHHNSVIFTNEECLMHRTSLMNELTLGVFKQRINDFYVFDHRKIKTSLSFCCLVFPFVSSFNVTNKSSNPLFWNRRLGHIPFNKL